MVFTDIFVQKDTPLHHVDPRVKLVFATMLTVFCLFVSDIVLLLLLFVALQLFIASTGVRWRAYSSSVLLVFRFAILLLLLWPFFDKAGDPVLIDLWAYKVTLPSLTRSLAVILRILVMASGWIMLMLTTRQGALVRALVKMGLRYDFGLSISIALRYVPHFVSTIAQIKDAQASRGFDVSKGGIVRRGKNLVPVLIPTIVSALRSADGLSSALVSRGYGARPDRTYYKDIRMKRHDAALLAVVATVMPIFMILDVLGFVNL